MTGHLLQESHYDRSSTPTWAVPAGWDDTVLATAEDPLTTGVSVHAV